MNRKVILLGRMGKLFGKEHKVKCKTTQEALHAIDCMVGGLRKYMMECSDLGIGFTIQRGGDIIDVFNNLIANRKSEHPKRNSMAPCSMRRHRDEQHDRSRLLLFGLLLFGCSSCDIFPIDVIYWVT